MQIIREFFSGLEKKGIAPARDDGLQLAPIAQAAAERLRELAPRG